MIYQATPTDLANLAKMTAIYAKPVDHLTVSEWADQNRVLSPEASAEPGRWATERAEYQRGMMDALTEPGTETITILSSSQIGKTEVLNNIIGYYISQDPSTILVIQPTLEMARAWSKDRLATMLRDTPCLVGKVKEKRAKDSSNEILHKTFPGGHLTAAGANSPASLASRPIRIVMLDEVDRYPASAGAEGDPVQLAIKRTQTFWNRKILLTSTPTVRGVSRIEQSWNESDQRHFHVPCPKCGTSQRLIFGQLKFDKNNRTWASYECEHCQQLLTEADKYNMVRQGEWVVSRPDIVGHAGFFINELYSPWSTWLRVAQGFLESKKRAETLRVFVNTVLGDLWDDEEAYSISESVLAQRVEKYDEIPMAAAVLTMGVDVQDDRIEVVVKAWGKYDESWLVDYYVLSGHPSQPAVWEQLDRAFKRTYPHEAGIDMRISCTAIDSGAYTHQVYQFTKPRQQMRVYAVKGFAGTGRPVIARPTQNNRFRALVYPVGVDTVKELVFSRLQISEHGPGYMHFNQKADLAYFEMLTAEKQVIQYKRGFPHKVWKKVRARNEALDCEVYALAALSILNPNVDAILKTIDAKKESDGNEEPETTDRREVHKLQQQKMARRNKGFATSWK